MVFIPPPSGGGSRGSPPLANWATPPVTIAPLRDFWTFSASLTRNFCGQPSRGQGQSRTLGAGQQVDTPRTPVALVRGSWASRSPLTNKLCGQPSEGQGRRVHLEVDRKSYREDGANAVARAPRIPDILPVKNGGSFDKGKDNRPRTTPLLATNLVSKRDAVFAVLARRNRMSASTQTSFEKRQNCVGATAASRRGRDGR